MTTFGTAEKGMHVWVGSYADLICACAGGTIFQMTMFGTKLTEGVQLCGTAKPWPLLMAGAQRARMDAAFGAAVTADGVCDSGFAADHCTPGMVRELSTMLDVLNGDPAGAWRVTCTYQCQTSVPPILPTGTPAF